MRIGTALLALLFCTAPLFAQTSRTIKETFDMSATGKVSIDTYKGSVVVETWSEPRIEIDIEILSEEDGQRGEEDVDLTEIRMRNTSRGVSLETDYDALQKKRKGLRFWNNNMNLPEVHYTIRMPAEAELLIDDYKSELRIAGLRSDLNIDTYKGTIDVTDHAGRFLLDTYKGDGHIAFADVTERIEVETYKGDITLVLPRSAGFDLDAELGKRGDLDSDFRLPRRDRDDETIRGEVNGGGPRLSLDTYKGSFRIDN
ncbi:MAG: DUF4097 family beta strand repeat-containing protein [Rhodothermales bacterium]